MGRSEQGGWSSRLHRRCLEQLPASDDRRRVCLDDRLCLNVRRLVRYMRRDMHHVRQIRLILRIMMIVIGCAHLDLIERVRLRQRIMPGRQ